MNSIIIFDILTKFFIYLEIFLLKQMFSGKFPTNSMSHKFFFLLLILAWLFIIIFFVIDIFFCLLSLIGFVIICHMAWQPSPLFDPITIIKTYRNLYVYQIEYKYIFVCYGQWCFWLTHYPSELRCHDKYTRTHNTPHDFRFCSVSIMQPLKNEIK